MLFCSWQFLVFFLAVFALHRSLPWPRARVWLLLVASYYFYASWNHWLALTIFVSTTLDFFLARAIEASPSARRRKLLVTLSVSANLGLLCYFKYTNFFLDSLGQLLRACGASISVSRRTARSISACRPCSSFTRPSMRPSARSCAATRTASSS